MWCNRNQVIFHPGDNRVHRHCLPFHGNPRQILFNCKSSGSRFCFEVKRFFYFLCHCSFYPLLWHVQQNQYKGWHGRAKVSLPYERARVSNFLRREHGYQIMIWQFNKNLIIPFLKNNLHIASNKLFKMKYSNYWRICLLSWWSGTIRSQEKKCRETLKNGSV